ncbi:hypothetical protein COO60DRAFT_560611 [Scenedesmus sp. NREL 46B-D3]|nr:hypothetical protein COO60DRAFT_560611 [Scenedesmus sp. NREL 46B-D3]
MALKMTSLMAVTCLLLAGAAAARPLGDGVGRELLAKPSRTPWGLPTACPNGISFGGYKAFMIPQHNLIAGNIQVYNRGRNTLNMRAAGFHLGPTKAARHLNTIKGGLRCPKQVIPAGGSLTCGFVAPASQPFAYGSFMPYVFPVDAQVPCFCPQQLPIVPIKAAASAQAAANPSAPPTFKNAQASSMATALAQAWSTGPALSVPAVPRWPAWKGNPTAFANQMCSLWFTTGLAASGPASSSATSNAESHNGDAAAETDVIAEGTISDATATANSVAHNGAAAANSNAAAKSTNGPAAVDNKASATGAYGAKATGSGQAVARGGPAISQSGANAVTKCGPAFAGNKAGALSNQAAIAAGWANAGSGCGPASAVSDTTAVVVPSGSHFVGPALASDKATAAGSTADAKSSATAVNAGNGPAVADSSAAAKGGYASSAAANSQAVANNGPALARSSAVSG